jgi:hypothetical protein
MLKNVLILCVSLVFSVSISAADLLTDQEMKPSQVTAEMESVTCEEADTVAPYDLDSFEPVELIGDELASRCCKVCKKGKACGDSCIARSKTCHKGRGCACDG